MTCACASGSKIRVAGSFARVLLASLFLLVGASSAHAARFRVCTLSFNAPNEVQDFVSHLPADEFDVVNLNPRQETPQSQSLVRTAYPATGAERPHVSWLENQCRPDLKCDVVVISGEFGGQFFGEGSRRLTLQQMEEASCQQRCAGLFHHPQEVFLLGCNTLASKDLDSRTPQGYLNVLLDHGFDEAEAERVVEMRYGPIGPSFRAAIRRIFMGVPRLYGFSSIAPSGVHSTPLLDAYFRARGDYGQYLRQSFGEARPNRPLLKAFAETALVQSSGLSPGDPGAGDRDLICSLYDQSQSVTSRLLTVQRMMNRSDFLAFVPTMQVFFRRHPPESFDASARDIFGRLRAQGAARRQTLRLIRALDSSAVKFQMVDFAAKFGWLTRAQLRRLAIEGAREQLVRGPEPGAVDALCQLTKREPIGNAFPLQDIPRDTFLDDVGLRLIQCLAPPDPRVTVRLAAALDDSSPSARAWAAYALSLRQPLSSRVLSAVALHLDDSSPEVRRRLRWILGQQPLTTSVMNEIQLRDHRFAEKLVQRPGLVLSRRDQIAR